MKANYFLLSAVAAFFFNACAFIEFEPDRNLFEGELEYNVLLDSIKSTYFPENYFDKYFRTEVRYKDEKGKTQKIDDFVKESNLGLRLVYSTGIRGVKLPFWAEIEVRHVLRTEITDRMSPYDKIPVYTGNLISVRLQDAGHWEEREKSTGYEWVAVSPLYNMTEIYLINVERFLAEYGVQRHTVKFTKEEWEINKRFYNKEAGTQEFNN